MADTFNLTAAFDKPAYNVGDTMTLTVSGTVVTDPSTPPPVAATLTVTAADGALTTLTANATINPTGGGSQTWMISKVSDTSNRTWTISADGASATATA